MAADIVASCQGWNGNVLESKDADGTEEVEWQEALAVGMREHVSFERRYGGICGDRMVVVHSGHIALQT